MARPLISRFPGTPCPWCHHQSEPTRRGSLQELSSVNGHQTFALRKRNAFVITDTELKLIAAAAIIGDNSKPNSG